MATPRHTGARRMLNENKQPRSIELVFKGFGISLRLMIRF